MPTCTCQDVAPQRRCRPCCTCRLQISHGPYNSVRDFLRQRSQTPWEKRLRKASRRKGGIGPAPDADTVHSFYEGIVSPIIMSIWQKILPVLVLLTSLITQVFAPSENCGFCWQASGWGMRWRPPVRRSIKRKRGKNTQLIKWRQQLKTHRCKHSMVKFLHAAHWVRHNLPG